MLVTAFAALLAMQASAAQVQDTIPAAGPRRPAVAFHNLRAHTPLQSLSPELPDTTQEIVEYSDAYGVRLTIHRWASYTMVPLFAFQYAAGRKLYDESASAPRWATKGHGIAATAVAGVFTLNSVTGVWNLLEARKDPEGRTLRTLHGVLMLVADAGFVTTGMLAEKAERNPDTRRLHRQIALSSMAVAGLGFTIMLPSLFGH